MTSSVLFSVAPDYYRSAVATLKRELEVTKVNRAGEDAAIITLDPAKHDNALAEVAAVCREGYLPFIRHLAAMDAQAKTTTINRRSPDEVVEWALEPLLDRLEVGEAVTLHVWDSGKSHWAPGKIRRPMLEALMDNGIRVITSGAQKSVDVCLGAEITTTGLTDSSNALSDWAGGRIRLASRTEQISRAEFKLEELFTFIDTPHADTAVDLGASPGGWTRILRSIGVRTVHAVDPAALDDRVLADRGVIHHRTTAGEFVGTFDGTVDLIVNDMRMVPHLTAHTMVDAARLLNPGGQAIVTFKLGTANPVKQWDESMEILVAAYEPTFIRQLQHNRHELTVVAHKR